MLNKKEHSLQQLLDEAFENVFNQKPLKALELYKEALFFVEDKEEKIEILFSIADLYSQLKNYKDASSVYKKILDIDNFISGAWYGLAYTNELLGGQIQSSLEAYEKAIEIDPNYKEAYYYAATIYGDIGETKKAISYLEKVIKLAPDDFVAYSDLGSLYEEENKLDKAKSFLEKSISLKEGYYLSHFNLGVVYKKLGNFDMALNEYKRASQYSDDMYIYLNMSAIYIENRDFKSAINILTEGISRKEHHILYYNRACSYRKNGNIKKALEDFQRAKEINKVVVDWAKNDPDLSDII